MGLRHLLDLGQGDKVKRLLAGLALSLAAAIASAQNAAPWIFVSDAWVFVNGGNVQAAGYLTVQDEGTALPQEPILNCVGANITCTDDAAHTRTLVTITGGGGGSVATDAIWTTAGQIAYATGNAAATVLGIGTANQVLHGGASAPSYSAVATGDIAASAVTYAKVQNETNATLLGNSSGGAAAPAEQTITAPMTLSGGALSVAVTPTNPGGAVASQATTPGTQQGSGGNANVNINGTIIAELDALATTPSGGVTLQNVTAAANGAQQVSPPLTLSGQGWNSTGSTSQAGNWHLYTLPIQQAGTIKQQLNFDSSVAGGAYANEMNLTGSGGLTLPNGPVTAAGVTSNGGSATYTLAASNAAQWVAGYSTELLTLSTSGLTTQTTGSLLPANSIIDAVVTRITTTITTTTNYAVGDATTNNRFSSASSTLTSGSTEVGLNQINCSLTTCTATNGALQAAASKVQITCTGSNPGAGVIRITVFYRTFTAPTS
jgi:hypothetical protein